MADSRALSLPQVREDVHGALEVGWGFFGGVKRRPFGAAARRS